MREEGVEVPSPSSASEEAGVSGEAGGEVPLS